LLAARDVLVIEVAAASSSAAGLICSPAMVEGFAPGVAGNPVDGCWPLGLETLGAPALADGYTLPTGAAALNATTDAAADDILFRWLDGAYGDNTNAAMTLSRMQADCAATGCEAGPFRMIIAGDSVQANLFFDPEYPPGSFLGLKQGGFNGPTPTIFAEAAPAADAWTVYASSGLRSDGTKAEARYWSGSVTTVANEWFGVAAGTSVELLYFEGCSDPIIVAGASAAQLFELVYAPSAQAQADGAASVIAQFLSGDLTRR
jgi:hypothetical protein